MASVSNMFETQSQFVGMYLEQIFIIYDEAFKSGILANTQIITNVNHSFWKANNSQQTN